MNKIKVAVVGYGNVGKYAVQGVLNAPDMEIAGIVRRSEKTAVEGVKVVNDIKELGKPDVAVLTTPSLKVRETAEKILSLGISTVDSFDVHSEIFELRRALNEKAAANHCAAVVSAGWDPGTDSCVRAMFEAMVPKGITYTNFGPGMSMGHTVCVKSKKGVKDALSLTIPIGTGLHRRAVYVEAEEGADIAEIARSIKNDPYFVKDETNVSFVNCVNDLIDFGHGVNLARKGVSGNTHNQMVSLEMRINNPALTSQIMVAAARAAVRQKPGAYTLIELPVIDLLPGDKEEIIRRLV